MAGLLIFDLDGTLIDSGADLAASINHGLASMGLPRRSLDEISSFVGDGMRMLVRRSLPADPSLLVSEARSNAEETLERIFREHYWEHCADSTEALPGVPETLEHLSGLFRMAVLTNKPEEPSRRILRALGLERHFFACVGGDSGPARKPNPAGVLHLVSLAGELPARCTLIGDGVQDFQAARSAGVRFVGIPSPLGANIELLGLAPEECIGDFRALPGVLSSPPATRSRTDAC